MLAIVKDSGCKKVPVESIFISWMVQNVLVFGDMLWRGKKGNDGEGTNEAKVLM